MIVTGNAKIFAAFIQARGEIGATVVKDAHGNYGKYATLAALTEATAAPLAKYGCALVQEASVDETGVTVATWLMHEAGGLIQFVPLTLPVSQHNAQAVGSAITYARRYALAAICGIAPDDDDGQVATNHAGATQKPQNAANGVSASKQAAPIVLGAGPRGLPAAAIIMPHSAPPSPTAQSPWAGGPTPSVGAGEDLFGKDAAAFNRMVPGANAGNPFVDTQTSTQHGISADADVLVKSASPWARAPGGSRQTPWYAAALLAISNTHPYPVFVLCDDLLTLHRSNGAQGAGAPCSPKAYGYLSGLLDSVIEQATAAKDGHKRVLPVLCQCEIGRDNLPSAALTSRLLDRLATHIKDDAGEKQPNPTYSQSTADAMVAVYRATEAVGTPSLLDA